MTTKQVLFVQGGGEDVHDQWDNKLVDSLRAHLGPRVDVRYPRMPDEADPKYALWAAALRREFAYLEPGAFLVGHSVGGTVLINVLAETPPRLNLGGIFLLAAPFLGDGGWPSVDVKPGEHLGAALSPDVPVYLYHGSDDEAVPVAHVDLYSRAIPHRIVRRLPGRDHQLNNDLADVAMDIRALAWPPEGLAPRR